MIGGDLYKSPVSLFQGPRLVHVAFECERHMDEIEIDVFGAELRQRLVHEMLNIFRRFSEVTRQLEIKASGNYV